ncbi:1-aminocyclopropane-1-carboxylate deaminase/D-cysteine desulfhydrase [Thorsellia kenyensis]|uniref:1-aminocyclopropane-1-carboxylate deaminase/D-cysteine desulfhydrase n=1 Tax=Thorsellia kenyensis TaxID=1549888 RepID=A0ABV6CBH8_9GAMM
MIKLNSVNLAASINLRLNRFPNLYIKREDAISATISGNKYRKLIFNLEYAKKTGFDTLLTFGGAYSNHIAAVAASAKECGFRTIGVIRGDELARKDLDTLNPTLKQAHLNNMHLHFVSRSEYQKRNEKEYQRQLIANFTKDKSSIYIIPEGGTNFLALKGCLEILTDSDDEFDIIACPVGTGGTITGIIQHAKKHQTVLGFPALEGGFLKKEIEKHLSLLKTRFEQDVHNSKQTIFNNKSLKCDWRLVSGYTFGGYAKTDESLIDFINAFYQQENIKLDPIYTGKMVYGIYDMLLKGEISEKAKVLMIHTGGLQGINGFNEMQSLHNKPKLLFNT